MDMQKHETFIEAPAAKVWETLVSSEGITTWYAFGGTEVDLRVGEKYCLNGMSMDRTMVSLKSWSPSIVLRFVMFRLRRVSSQIKAILSLLILHLPQKVTE